MASGSLYLSTEMKGHHPVMKYPSNSALNVPSMTELYLEQFGEEKCTAFEKVLLFDFQEAFSCRLYDSFLLTGLPRVEVKHSAVDQAIQNIDALVYPFPEARPPDSPNSTPSPLLQSINKAIEEMFKRANQPYPSNWFLKELELKYLENSFDNTLPVNKVVVIPFGPNPELPLRFGLPSFTFGVSVWRNLNYFDKDTAIKDALRSVFAKISAHNQKGKRSPLIKSVAIPTFFTGTVDNLYGGDARNPAWQMAAAYLEYLTARGVPKTPRNLARIDDTLLFLLDRGIYLTDAEIAARGIVSRSELNELLAHATKPLGEGESAGRKRAALRMIQIYLRERRTHDPKSPSAFWNRPTLAENILQAISSRTAEQVEEAKIAAPNLTRKSSFFEFFSGAQGKATPPTPVAHSHSPLLAKTYLEVFIQSTSQGDFEPWVPVQNDDFDIGHKVGQGAEGTVKLVTRKSDGEKLVIKEFANHGKFYSSTDSHTNSRVKMEVSFMSLLKHENLMTAVGANLIGPDQYVVMPRADLDLFHLVHPDLVEVPALFADKVPNTIPQCVNIAKQIAMGMAELHRLDVIHRDLKSLNVLMNWNHGSGWHAKVSDFGTTRVTSNLMTSKVGTFVWMAPEVDNDNNRLSSYTKAADIWSYGILLWELFSKKKPELCKELVLQRTSANPLSPVVTELIKTCLHPEPGSRPTFVGLLKGASATGVLTLDYVVQNSK